MRAEAYQAPFRLGHEGKGEITVISDGAEYLKRLRKALPQPATHILDWFHIAMKLRLIEHRAASLSRRPLSEALSDLAEKIACLRWRIWNGQAERALARVSHLLRLSKGDELGSTTSHLLQQGLMTLRPYIEQNLDSIANYAERYRSGKRIASTSAEASVNALVAKRMVKKQQMRWSERGANLLLQVRVALANGDLEERLAYKPPVQPQYLSFLTSCRCPSSSAPLDPRQLNGPKRHQAISTRTG